MTIDKALSGSELTVALTGRLDTTTAPQLEAELAGAPEEITGLILDLAGLEYLSSAGLRVILSTQKRMTPPRKMTVRNVNETVMEIFEITGFVDILNIE